MGKAPVIYLLLSARRIESNNLDGKRIIEVRDRRIVERKVAILADAHANQVERALGEKTSIASGFEKGRAFRREQMNVLRPLDPGEQMSPKERAKTLRMIGSKAGVLIHVEDNHPGPVNRESHEGV